MALTIRKIGAFKVYHRPDVDYSLYPKAPLRLRAAAFVIDTTFQGSLIALLQLLSLQIFADSLNLNQWLLSVTTVLFGMFFYSFIPLILHGQTIGKRAVGIRLVTEHYSDQLSLLSVVLREAFGKGVFIIGSILALVDKDHRAFHDYLASTRVISYREYSHRIQL